MQILNRNGWRRAAHALIACAIFVTAGCEGVESSRLVDYLDELEFDVPLETAAYVSLGRYDIPISASRRSESKFVQQIAERGLVWMRLQFELTAETTPENEKAILEAAEKHRGSLNDAVLTVVRTSTVDELADPRLAAINARLSEAARPLLGEGLVRQFVFNDPATAEAKAAAHQAQAGHGGGHGGGHDDASHGDAAHGEKGHGEAGHGDAEHGEAGHGDKPHGEEAHSDKAHGEEAHGKDAHGHH